MSEGLVECADAIEFMREIEDQEVDHIITDPPYGKHTHEAQRQGCNETYVEPTRPNATKAQFNRKRDLGFDHLTSELRTDCAREFARITKRWVLIFSDHEGGQAWADDLKAAGLDVVRFGIWRKKGAAPQFTGDRPGQGHEVIIIAHQTHPNGKPKRKFWNGGGKHGFWEHAIVLNRGKKKHRLHTTQKPLPLMEDLVSDFTSEGETILDPFCGSGTTLLAAKNLGRNWVGVDFDEKNVEISQARLEGVLLVEQEPDRVCVVCEKPNTTALLLAENLAIHTGCVDKWMEKQ